MPQLEPRRAPPPDYYADNLRFLLDEVARRDRDLLDWTELAFIDAWGSASTPAQRLLARLFTRKGPYIRADRLSYDEIANVPLGQQQKLLRVLETGEFERLGSSRTRKADVRLISATNADLNAEVVAGRFRQDLLFRLNVVNLKIPPLRERPADIAELAHHFVRKYSQVNGLPLRPLSTEVLDLFEADWGDPAGVGSPEQVEALRRCVGKLNTRARDLLHMKYFEGLTAGAIAGRMRRTADAVYQNLSRLHRALRDCVEREMAGPPVPGCEGNCP